MAEKGLTFHIAYGATREDGDRIGAWWSEDHGGHIQPAEFLLGRGDVVLASMYASGPVGLIGADEARRMINYGERQRKEEAGEGH